MRLAPRSVSRFVAFVALLAVFTAWAQDYPNKPVRIVVPTAPGNPLDVVMRLVGERMKDSLGQPVVIDNRAGGNAVIGFNAVLGQPADGYTLLMSVAGLPAAKFLVKSFTADPVNDFTHIGMMTILPLAFVVNANSPFKSMGELLAYAKANPGKVSFGSLSGPFLIDAALFESMAGVKLLMVAHQNALMQQTALLASQLDASIEPYAMAKAFADSGKTRVLGVGSPKRSPLMPNVPAVAEFVPGYEASQNFFGLSGPAGLPPAVVAKVNASMRAALAVPDVKGKLNGFGYDVVPSSPAEYKEFIAREYERIGKAAQIAGVQPQ